MKKHPAEKDNLSHSTSELMPSISFPSNADLIPAEVSFENIGYFTPSSKRIKQTTTKERTIAELANDDGTKTILRISIIASGKYGLPITSDLDYYRAFLKILDEFVEREGEIKEPIGIPTKKIIRYAGKKANARELQEVKDWIRRNHTTAIQGHFYIAEKGDYVEIGDEPLFPRYRMRGQRLENGEIAETNYVWLASWFRSNYHYHHLRPIDLTFHIRLRKPISKSLFPLLEIGWYASSGKPYSKSYRSLCQEFLLKEYTYASDIKRQLDPSHRELQKEQFLDKWEYRRSSKGNDWIITYHPGEKFYSDQKARASRRQLAENIAKRKKSSQPQQLNLIKDPVDDSDDKENHILAEILEVCGDTQNEAAYRNAIRTYPEGIIWTAISETKQAQMEDRIKKTNGAYFMDALKHLKRLRTRG